MNEEVFLKMKKLCAAVGVFSASFFVGTKVSEIQNRLSEVYKYYEETDKDLSHTKNNNEEALAFALEEKNKKDQYHFYSKQLEDVCKNLEEYDPERLIKDETFLFLEDYKSLDIEELIEEKQKQKEAFEYIPLEKWTSSIENETNSQEIEKEEKTTVETVQIIPREGEITISEIDFNRIASSKENAELEDFSNIEAMNEEYWNTMSLTYEIDKDDIVTIYNGDHVFGFTDIEGVAFDGELAPILEEEIMLASNESEEVLEEETGNFVLDDTIQIEPTEINEDYVWEYIDESASLMSMHAIPEIPKIVGEDNFEIKPGYHKTYYNKTYDFTEEELRLLGFVVEFEARRRGFQSASGDVAEGGNYEDALGTVSIILNRLENPKYSTDLTEVLTSPFQFEVYTEEAYEAYVAAGKEAPEYVQKAIEHATVYGIRNLDYLSWKASNTDYDKDEPDLNERRYKMVSGGNVYHNLAKSVARTELLEEMPKPVEESTEEIVEDQNESAKVYLYSK